MLTFHSIRDETMPDFPGTKMFTVNEASSLADGRAMVKNHIGLLWQQRLQSSANVSPRQPMKQVQ
jgi:hypothetical protein